MSDCNCPDRDLGNCRLRRAGCETLHDVLVYLYPPYSVRAKLAGDPDPDVREWLNRLQVIGELNQYSLWGEHV